MAKFFSVTWANFGKIWPLRLEECQNGFRSQFWHAQKRAFLVFDLLQKQGPNFYLLLNKRPNFYLLLNTRPNFYLLLEKKAKLFLLLTKKPPQNFETAGQVMTNLFNGDLQPGLGVTFCLVESSSHKKLLLRSFLMGRARAHARCIRRARAPLPNKARDDLREES